MTNKYIEFTEDKHYKIDKDTKCHNWIKGKSHNYGQVQYQNIAYPAHRLSWIFKHGSISEDLLVCHKCDNPSCINPNHLFLGTQKDNMQDCIDKGRFNRPKGEQHGSSKLTWKKVEEIRSLFSDKIHNQTKLSKMYNVNQKTISSIVHYKLWK